MLRGEGFLRRAKVHELANSVHTAIAGAPVWARNREPVRMTRGTSVMLKSLTYCRYWGEQYRRLN